MQYRQKNRLSYILAVSAVACAMGATGCQHEPDRVPSLSEPASPASSESAKPEEAKPAETPKAPEATKPAEAPKPAEEAPKPAVKADEKPAAVVLPATPGSGTPVASATEEKSRSAAPAESATAAAKDLGTQLASFEIPSVFGAAHGRLVVQVNLPRNDSESPVDDLGVAKAIRESLSANSKLESSNKLHGASRSGRVKAIHLAFEPESRALGLIPSSKLSDAPDVIVNTAVSRVGDELLLTLTARQTQTGKVFWTSSKPITSASVLVAPVSEPVVPADAGTPPEPTDEMMTDADSAK